MNTQNTIQRFLGFSQFEIITAVVIALLVIAAALYTVFYSTPEVKQYFIYQQQQPRDVDSRITAVSDEVNQSEFAADAAIFVFWSSVGLIGYAIASSIKRLFVSLREFEETLVDGRTNKVLLIREAILRLVVRIGSVGLLFMLASFVFTGLTAIFLSTIQAYSDDYTKLALSLFAAIVVAFLLTHATALLLRLVRMRLRVFGTLV